MAAVRSGGRQLLNIPEPVGAGSSNSTLRSTLLGKVDEPSSLLLQKRNSNNCQFKIHYTPIKKDSKEKLKLVLNENDVPPNVQGDPIVKLDDEKSLCCIEFNLAGGKLERLYFNMGQRTTIKGTIHCYLIPCHIIDESRHLYNNDFHQMIKNKCLALGLNENDKKKFLLNELRYLVANKKCEEHKGLFLALIDNIHEDINVDLLAEISSAIMSMVFKNISGVVSHLTSVCPALICKIINHLRRSLIIDDSNVKQMQYFLQGLTTYYSSLSLFQKDTISCFIFDIYNNLVAESSASTTMFRKDSLQSIIPLFIGSVEERMQRGHLSNNHVTLICTALSFSDKHILKYISLQIIRELQRKYPETYGKLSDRISKEKSTVKIGLSEDAKFSEFYLLSTIDLCKKMQSFMQSTLQSESSTGRELIDLIKDLIIALPQQEAVTVLNTILLHNKEDIRALEIVLTAFWEIFIFDTKHNKSRIRDLFVELTRPYFKHINPNSLIDDTKETPLQILESYCLGSIITSFMWKVVNTSIDDSLKLESFDYEYLSYIQKHINFLSTSKDNNNKWTTRKIKEFHSAQLTSLRREIDLNLKERLLRVLKIHQGQILGGLKPQRQSNHSPSGAVKSFMQGSPKLGMIKQMRQSINNPTPEGVNLIVKGSPISRTKPEEVWLVIPQSLKLGPIISKRGLPLPDSLSLSGMGSPEVYGILGTPRSTKVRSLPLRPFGEHRGAVGSSTKTPKARPSGLGTAAIQPLPVDDL